LEDLGVDVRIIGKLIFKKWYGCMDWILQAQKRERWRTVLNAIMKFKVPINVQGIS